MLRALNPQCSAARFKSASASLLASSACHSAASVKARVHDAARRKLPPSHVDDALAQRLRFGRRRRLGQFRERHGRHLDVHVEAIEQRTRDPRAIGVQAIRRAKTARRAVAAVAAWARIHCRDELKIRGEHDALVEARDVDDAGLDRRSASRSSSACAAAGG